MMIGWIVRTPTWIPIVMIGVLCFASSRTSYALTTRMDKREEGNRPKPSRQTLPSDPVRVAPEAHQVRDRSVGLSMKALDMNGHDTLACGRFTIAKAHLVRATSQPDYLRLARSADPHNHLSPPQ